MPKMPALDWKHARRKARAAALAFAAVALALHFSVPAVQTITEAADIMAGKLAYCANSQPNCVTFLPERWIAGIASGTAAAGLFYALARASKTAWDAHQERYAVEFDVRSAQALALGAGALAVVYLVEAWKWSRFFIAHENVLFNTGMAVICASAALIVWSESAKMSKGQAMSIEINRHTQ
ncbi:MAG: hypothetical protein V1787_03985 [Candidatus Micrarchaeota archaeon]